MFSFAQSLPIKTLKRYATINFGEWEVAAKKGWLSFVAEKFYFLM